MADLQNRGAVADVEGALSRLRGITSARVVTDERGDIVEIHVLAEEGRHPKQISRDIESALFSEFGIRVDHRKISIAQTRGPEEPAAGPRLKFLGIDYSIDRTSARARVSVGRGDEIFIGAASTVVGDVNQEELVARATLEAVHEYARSTPLANGDLSMELRDFSRSEGNGISFFAVKPLPKRIFKTGDLITVIVRQKSTYKHSGELDVERDVVMRGLVFGRGCVEFQERADFRGSVFVDGTYDFGECNTDATLDAHDAGTRVGYSRCAIERALLANGLGLPTLVFDRVQPISSRAWSEPVR